MRDPLAAAEGQLRRAVEALLQRPRPEVADALRAVREAQADLEALREQRARPRNGRPHLPPTKTEVQQTRALLQDTIVSLRCHILREVQRLEEDLRQVAAEAATAGSEGPKIAEILAQGAASHGVGVEAVTGPCKVRRVVLARDEAALLLRQLGLSLPAIGRVLGGRDHSTIWAALRRAEANRLGP